MKGEESSTDGICSRPPSSTYRLLLSFFRYWLIIGSSGKHFDECLRTHSLGNSWEFCLLHGSVYYMALSKSSSGLSTRNLTCILWFNVLNGLMRWELWELFSLFYEWGNKGSENLSGLLMGVKPTPVWPQRPWTSLHAVCFLARGSESQLKPKDGPRSVEFWIWCRRMQNWPKVIKTWSKRDHSLDLLKQLLQVTSIQIQIRETTIFLEHEQC